MSRNAWRVWGVILSVASLFFMMMRFDALCTGTFMFLAICCWFMSLPRTTTPPQLPLEPDDPYDSPAVPTGMGQPSPKTYRMMLPAPLDRDEEAATEAGYFGPPPTLDK